MMNPDWFSIHYSLYKLFRISDASICLNNFVCLYFILFKQHCQGMFEQYLTIQYDSAAFFRLLYDDG